MLLDAPEALLAGDLDAMRALARTLVLSGIGMTICGGSYPASQGEHLISHYIDMFAPAGRATYFHGEQVAVATLTMARIQEEVLAGGPPRLRAVAVTCAELQRLFGAGDRANRAGANSSRSACRGDAAPELSRAHRATVWDDTVRRRPRA